MEGLVSEVLGENVKIFKMYLQAQGSSSSKMGVEDARAQPSWMRFWRLNGESRSDGKPRRFFRRMRHNQELLLQSTVLKMSCFSVWNVNCINTYTVCWDHLIFVFKKQGSRFLLVHWSMTTKTASGPVELSFLLVHQTSNFYETCQAFSQPIPQMQRWLCLCGPYPWVNLLLHFSLGCY